jgi:lactoylglutathione lyase
VAFNVALDALLEAPGWLAAHGVAPLSFFGEPASEPSVIGWMPAAAVYFRDPDGHLLEHLAMLEEAPRPDLGIVPWSTWQSRPSRGVSGSREATGTRDQREASI